MYCVLFILLNYVKVIKFRTNFSLNSSSLIVSEVLLLKNDKT